jgi:hypothetical protein
MTVALRQTPRSPRVLRTHLHAYLCRIYATTSVQVLGFASIGLLTPLCRLYPLAVRQSSALPTASSGFHLTVDTLAVQLTLPLAGCVEDLHLLVNAPYRAHQGKSPTLIEGGAFIVPTANYSGHFHSRISFLSLPFSCA